MSTEPMLPSEAMLWLAGLEKSCTECTAKDGIPCNCLACHGTGKVAVLDLREPCPVTSGPNYIHYLGVSCDYCQGRNWVPKQGEAALHQAMHKADFSQMHVHVVGQGPRHYYWPYERSYKSSDCHANDYLAAVKAMRAAGYA